ncbi:hypothetical protein [Ruegeria lacuscaerulensis]|uniref:hypothetical protein n=1 Tax=Ruegeria lacuscaerulensis TaxID=55218 RepID=UPI00147C57DC|nr:hypothetical protein [Ruegeria lacuscaerulensis]
MESEGQVLDEDKLDSAIADLLREEADEEPEQQNGAEAAARSEQVFPELPGQEEIDEQAAPQEIGFAASLLQKWADLRGAA